MNVFFDSCHIFFDQFHFSWMFFLLSLGVNGLLYVSIQFGESVLWHGSIYTVGIFLSHPAIRALNSD